MFCCCILFAFPLVQCRRHNMGQTVELCVGVTGCVCVPCGLWIHLLFMPVAPLDEYVWAVARAGLLCWMDVIRIYGWNDSRWMWNSHSSDRPSLPSDRDNVSGWLPMWMQGCIPTKPHTIINQSVLDMTQAHTANRVTVDRTWSKRAVTQTGFPSPQVRGVKTLRIAETSLSWNINEDRMEFWKSFCLCGQMKINLMCHHTNCRQHYLKDKHKPLMLYVNILAWKISWNITLVPMFF